MCLVIWRRLTRYILKWILDFTFPQGALIVSIEMDFKSTPYHHQLVEWQHSKDLPARAILWEQGTGKSKYVVDTAAHLWLSRKIDCVLVIAPNGVHRNWVEQEIPEHLPDVVFPDLYAFAFLSSRAETKYHQKRVQEAIRHPGLSWVTMSYEAFMIKRGHDLAKKLFDDRRVFYILDESQYVKEPTARRTKSVLNSAKYAPIRRILTGTPVSQGPFDLYTQFKFLDADFWVRHGFSSFTEFKHYFGVWKRHWNPTAYNPFNKDVPGREFEICVGYQRLEELQQIIKELASRVTKEDVLDLPPKVYQKRHFEMTSEQSRLYREMKDDFIAWIKVQESLPEGEREPSPIKVCERCGGTGEVVIEDMAYPCTSCPPPDYSDMYVVVASQAMIRVLRLQQIACGYLPTPDGSEPIYQIPGVNRRVEATVEMCVNSPHKVIVWARFQMDITLILKALEEAGIRAVRYDGQVGEDDRKRAKDLFTGSRAIFRNGQVVGRESIPEEEQAKVFVGNPAAGATGLTLTQAKTVIYHSNSFKLVDRLQSEDRAHRIGQTDSVLYVDVVALDTIDDRVIGALRDKLDVANQITGDRAKDWI